MMVSRKPIPWDQTTHYVYATCKTPLPGVPLIYAYTRRSGNDAEDVTSYHPGQHYWSPDNMPETMYFLYSPKCRNQFRNKPRPGPMTDINGVVLLERWPEGETKIRELRDFPILPERIGTNEEWWVLEAWRRLDPRVTWEDIIMRMSTPRPSVNGLNMRCKRGRERFNMLSWHGTAPNQSWIDMVMSKLNHDQIHANTTRGLTPGLVNPFAGEAGGRIPIPTAHPRCASTSLTSVLKDEHSKEMETPGRPRRSSRASCLPQRYVTETFDDTPTSNKRRRRADDTGDADSQSHTTLDGNTPKRRRGRPSLRPVTPALTQPSAVESEAPQLHNHNMPQHGQQLDRTPIGFLQYGRHRTPTLDAFSGHEQQSSQDTIGQYGEQQVLPDTLTQLGQPQASRTTMLQYGQQQDTQVTLTHYEQQQAPYANMTQNGLRQTYQDEAPQSGPQQASRATMVQYGQQQDSPALTTNDGLQHGAPATNPPYVPRSSYAALGEYGKPPPPPMTPLQRAQHLRALADPQYALKLRNQTTPMYGQHDPRATHNRFGQYIGPSTLSTPHIQHEPLQPHVPEFSPAGEAETQPLDVHPVAPSQNTTVSSKRPLPSLISESYPDLDEVNNHSTNNPSPYYFDNAIFNFDPVQVSPHESAELAPAYNAIDEAVAHNLRYPVEQKPIDYDEAAENLR